MSNGSFFACGVECVRSKSVGYVGALRTMTAMLKRTSGGCAVFEGLHA